MKYRVGKKQNRVILDENGKKVAECLEGKEEVAQQICDLLNDKDLVNNLSQHLVTKRNWFEKLPLHIKLLLHTGVGVLLGLTIAYVW